MGEQHAFQLVLGTILKSWTPLQHLHSSFNTFFFTSFGFLALNWAGTVAGHFKLILAEQPMKSQWGASDSSYQLLHTNVLSFPAMWTFPSLIRKGLIFFYTYTHKHTHIHTHIPTHMYIWIGLCGVASYNPSGRFTFECTTFSLGELRLQAAVKIFDRTCSYNFTSSLHYFTVQPELGEAVLQQRSQWVGYDIIPIMLKIQEVPDAWARQSFSNSIGICHYWCDAGLSGLGRGGHAI